MTAEGARVLRLQPEPERHYVSCPRWCRGHDDGPDGRRHAGPRALVSARAVDTGRMVDVGLSVEMRDDGHGTAREVFVFDTRGPVELTATGMHQLMKDVERVFWKVDAQGALIGGYPQPAARQEAAAATSAPRTLQNRGGRA